MTTRPAMNLAFERLTENAPRAAVLALLACAVTAVPTRAATCESLASLALPHTSITVAEARPAGEFAPPEGRAVPNLPAFCRVAGVLKPSSDSDIHFEVWLPASGWNSKFQGVGNGGFAGSISYSGLANAVSHGYATASTDTGHEAGGTDAAWALRHPEKIIDFGYRAIHETAETAKAIIHAFYGEAPKRSYFDSCSDGGREALMEAQRYPVDYDGIIAGAPANYWTHLVSASAWDMQATLSDPATYISVAKLPAIQAAALKACDAIDGVKDGVIENPPQCHFDPGVLLCQGAESDGCLTAAQVDSLRKIYRGPEYSSHAPMFPGYSPGGEAADGGWAAWITGRAPETSLMFAFSTQFFKNMVYDNPSWRYQTFDVDRDTRAADEKAAPSLNATNPDLAEFHKRGGKLILYHGWSDAAIPATNTVNYYRTVQARMGAATTASFVRLYMVPGMEHCGGGNATDSFGAGSVPHADREHDLDAALEAWVEQGTAPGSIIATQYKTDQNPASGVLRTRPLCPYPQIAHWKDSGSTDDAANFVCANPDTVTGQQR